MPASYQTYTADGATATFSVPFPYLSRDHVFLGVAGVQVPFTWDSDTSVRPATVPLAGQIVEVRRFTPTQSPIDFSDGAVILEDTLDILARYCAYLAEETREAAAGSAGSWTPYTLPIAGPTTLGGVKIGSGINRAPDGTISAAGASASPYTLPAATPSTLGGIKVGANLTVTPDGTVSAPAPSSGGTAPLGGVALADFTMDASTPQALIKFPETNPAGWNTGVGKMTVDTEIYFSNYFAANPNGHMAMILRNTPSLLMSGGAVRGQGILFGDGRGFSPYPNAHAPAAQIESWFNPYPSAPGPANTLPKNTETPPGVLMKDNTPYRVIIESSKANDGNRYVRFRVYSKDTANTPNQWLCIHDTGDVLDINNGADLTQSGFGLGHVFASNLSAWSIQFTNCKITWGPASDALPDLRGRFSRYGGDLEGDLSFSGDSRRLRVKCDGAAYTNAWTVLEPTTDNTNAALIARPRGTARAAGYSAVNNPSTVTYGSIGMNMLADRGRISTFSIGGEPVRPIELAVQGTPVATVQQNGIILLDAALPLGTQSPNFWALNLDGSNVLMRSQNAVDWNSICANGTIASYVNSYGAAQGVELVALPLYGALGRLITELRYRRVI